MKQFELGVRVDDTAITHVIVEAVNGMDAVQIARHKVERKGYTFNDVVYCKEVKNERI